MKIIKIKNSYYIQDEDNLIKLENEVVQKFKIYLETNNYDFKLIILENEYYFYYKMALKRLSRMQSELMLKNYLLEKGIRKSILNQVITSLKKLHYLDDYEYALNYKDLKQYSYGPRKISANLINNGVSKEIIDEVILMIDEEEILTNLIQKELTKIKSSLRSYEQKLLRKYYQKGFSLKVISKVLSNELKNILYDETIDLEKEYYKILNKAKLKKLSDTELKYHVRNKLLQKGYRIDDIKKVEE